MSTENSAQAAKGDIIRLEYNAWAVDTNEMIDTTTPYPEAIRAYLRRREAFGR